MGEQPRINDSLDIATRIDDLEGNELIGQVLAVKGLAGPVGAGTRRTADGDLRIRTEVLDREALLAKLIGKIPVGDPRLDGDRKALLVDMEDPVHRADVDNQVGGRRSPE
ncbi:unannotated protein [freshwater metagenome]|uniref:Unannotated protein n=1 Tax=freshwater metagenome TaxID=449393 RepID=A0A6J7Q5H2_9ZZZZ